MSSKYRLGAYPSAQRRVSSVPNESARTHLANRGEIPNSRGRARSRHADVDTTDAPSSVVSAMPDAASPSAEQRTPQRLCAWPSAVRRVSGSNRSMMGMQPGTELWDVEDREHQPGDEHPAERQYPPGTAGSVSLPLRLAFVLRAQRSGQV